MSSPGRSRSMPIGRQKGRTQIPGVIEPVGVRVPPSVAPSSTNSRSVSRPYLQGRERGQVFVGIDVSKDELEGCAGASGEALVVSRENMCLADLGEWLRGVPP